MKKIHPRLRQVGEVSDLPARALVSPSKRQGEEIILVEAGAMMLSKTLPDGRRQVVGFRLADNLMTLGGNSVMRCVTLQAVAPSRIRRITGRSLERLLETEPGSCNWLLDQIGDEIAALQGQLLTVGRRNKEERLAAFLLEMCYRTGGGTSEPPEVFLPMHRLEIADYLGLTPETVSRVFAGFSKDQFIALPNPSHVRLLNPAALKDLALGLGPCRHDTGYAHTPQA